MSDRLKEIAQSLAEGWLAAYDLMNIIEQQDELGLTDDEVDEVWDRIVDAEVKVLD